MAQFEGYERREAKILAALKNYGISSIDECKDICASKGIDPYTIVGETQPICFENAKWAYTVGSAIAIKEAERTGDKSAATAAANIGIGRAERIETHNLGTLHLKVEPLAVARITVLVCCSELQLLGSLPVKPHAEHA